MSDSAPINEYASSSAEKLVRKMSVGRSLEMMHLRKMSTVSESERAEQNTSRAYVFLSKNKILLVLCIVGVLTGLVNGLAVWLVSVGSKAQAKLLMHNDLGPLYFILTTTALCALSALIIKSGGLAATFGSGLPEVKTLLVNDFLPSEYPLLVSPSIFFLRLFSLVSAAASGLAVGLAAPLVHASVSTAYCVVHYIPFFKELEESSPIMKQIFAASAAVGLTTVFNAPVGGLLFSVEVTSTYYLISNYWRSFMAATIGAVIYAIVMRNGREGDYRLYPVTILLNPYHTWEFGMFVLIGVLTGVLSYLYLQMHQRWFLFVRPYTAKHPIATAALAGTVSALLIWAVGAYSDKGVTGGMLVTDLFDHGSDHGSVSEMDRYHVSPIGGLFAGLVVRVVLSLLGTTLRISAGVFLPMLTMGALIGRIFGQVLQEMVTEKGSIYLGGYAMVGAVGLASGTTHTISAAVMVAELTGQFDMILPCLIAAVISCGITKTISLSLYDQGMVNKGLESFELLLKSSGSYQTAGEIMDQGCIHVTNKCSVRDLVTLLEDDKQQSIFPIISDDDGRVLQGSLGRKEMFLFVKRVFEKQSLMATLRALLPVDCEKTERKRGKGWQHSAAWLALRRQSVKFDSKQVMPRRLLSRLFQPPASTTVKTKGDEAVERASHESDTISLSGFGSQTSLASYSEGSRVDEVGESGAAKSVPAPLNLSAGLVRTLSLSPLPTSTSTAEKQAGPSLASLSYAPSQDSNPKRDAGLAGESAVLAFILDTKVILSEEALLPINSFPYTTASNATMDQLYVLFEMVHVSCVFVVGEGKSLQGIISKKAVLKNIKRKFNTPQ